MADPGTKRYVEDPDFVPDPTVVVGTIDTSGTGGGTIRQQTPIFDAADRQDLITAQRALDPNDREVSRSLVTLPEGASIVIGDAEGARKRLEEAAKEAKDNPVNVLSPTPGEVEAAKSDLDTSEGKSEPGVTAKKPPSRT